MSAPLRYGELFAGAGGMSLGLERAGLSCAFHAELADFPRRVLEHRWPDVPLYGDVAQLDGRALVASHGPLDLLAGGSPCQDMSVAGKRAGLAGARSGLFYEQLRLWNETGATYILWENVAGALSSNTGADFAAVLSAIVGGPVAVPSDGWRGGGVVSGPGAVAAWRLLDAQWFGVPQHRLRVFVLGARAGGVDPAEVLLEPQGVRRHPPTRGEAGEVAPSIAGSGAGTARTGNARTESGLVQVVAFDWQKGNDVENPRPSTMNVTEEQTGTLAATRVPAVLAFDTTQVTSPENRCNPQPDDPCHPLAATGHAPLVVPIQEVGKRTGTSTTDPRAGIGIGNDGDPMYTLQAGAQHGVVCTTGDVTHALTHEGHDASEDGTGRGTPIVFNEHGHEQWASQAVVGPLNAHEAKEPHTLALDVQNCLTSEDVFATLDSGAARGNRGPQVHAGIPRRLMPVECEALMSWPRDWTNVPDEKGKPASDAARYKACGNGVVSNVAQWIGERLASAHAAMTSNQVHRDH